MVNRGGRSKGCGTCRGRRLKCDEGRPHCQRCHKAGLQCRGYALHANFVDETARFRREDQVTANTLVPTLVPMSLQPDEDTVLHTHLVARLLPRVSGPASPHILASMANYESSSTAVVPLHKDALRALAAVYFGKVHRDTRVFGAGVRAYVRSLGRLRTAVADPVAVRDVETLASALCLGLVENVALTETTGWLAHYDGLAHLIERRGPAQHMQAGFGRELFLHCRFAIVISALLRRRPCYLAQPAWRAVAQDTSPEGELMDLFAEVPGILHDLGGAAQTQAPDATPQSGAGLRRRVEHLLLALSAWRQQRQLPPRASSASHADLSMLALHHAILLCLTPVCDAFHVSIVAGQAPMDAEAARRSVASDICRLAKASFDRNPSSTGAFLFIFPLHVAARHLPPGADEAVWAETAMQRVIVETHGFEIGRPRTWYLESGRVTGSASPGSDVTTLP
ncbi:uncharacterized protein SPSK_00130 [Sporothrix schenckii 1099-18]|uniref:Zn(2)-C6 fungal-type domain-containing protein n=2 Tax=Sporothrix schenckii TaxID=29908 RepID=U7PJ72_SPOS1|nr:uncharacterized protein SPSK_00130 [Sporothrix schenckii 1099-18]ERS95693.1 hypothetical protein HMPREF1624_07768 [Sporothrix schenckii ATCC 58251]KJR83708.1 hypothetical protein SPSK_00130 [Sporothrix schenckii 1099-18]